MSNVVKIKGGVPLVGDVTINGSKNAISAILPAVCLAKPGSHSVIKNVPNISDIETHCAILKEIGITASFDREQHTLDLFGSVEQVSLSETNAPKIRASNLYLGALLAVKGEVHMPFCGGDQIGDRPLDIHFSIFHKFKINTEIKDGHINCYATEFPLKAATVYLRYPSVGATENALLVASLAKGTSYIYNAACEPEITDLAIALNNMGAQIHGAGTPIIRVTGVKELSGISHEVIPDRLEYCTFLMAFACTHGKGRILGGIPEHSISVLQTLIDSGVSIRYEDGITYVDATCDTYNPINVSALPYPGLPTDVQPLRAVCATLCKGTSVIQDSVFKNRFGYAKEFSKMGITSLRLYDHLCVSGPQQFKGAHVIGRDIRAASALVLAALCTTSDTILTGYSHVARGYENFVSKLRTLGALIEF